MQAPVSGGLQGAGRVAEGSLAWSRAATCFVQQQTTLPRLSVLLNDLLPRVLSQDDAERHSVGGYQAHRMPVSAFARQRPDDVRDGTFRAVALGDALKRMPGKSQVHGIDRKLIDTLASDDSDYIGSCFAKVILAGQARELR